MDHADASLVPAPFAARMAGRPADGTLPGRGVDGDAWLRELPRRVEAALDAWELRVEGVPRHGTSALVVPVVRVDGTPAALKVTWPHAEAAHEHLALRAWGGGGAVRLLAADPANWTVLLERLDPDTDLTGIWDVQACEVIGRLLADLDRPALPRLTRLSELVGRWVERLAIPPAGLPRRFVEQARALLRDLSAGSLDARLVHTDLHYENVLGPQAGQARGRDWVAIDPKPLAAEPAFAVWPALHNRLDEAGDDVPGLAWSLGARLGAICEAGGIDEDRARAWAIVRTVLHAVDTLDAGDPVDEIEHIALLKALQRGA